MNRVIVAVHPNTDLYGSDRVFLTAVEQLRVDTSLQIRTVLGARGQLSAEMDRIGLPYTVLAFPVLRKKALGTVLAALCWTFGFASSLPRLTRWLRRQGTDVLYVNTVICPVWVLAGRLAGCAVVVHVHESETGLPSWMRNVLLAQLRVCTGVIANSKSTAQWIASAGTGLNRKTQVIYNGVAEATTARTLPQPSLQRQLVLIGRLNERKGQHLAIEVLRLLRARGLDVALTLVGDVYPGYESYYERLRELTDLSGLTDFVTFTGFVSDTSPHLASAEVLLVPSSVESFGNAAVEAMLAGVSVVASAVQGLTEVIDDEQTGLLVRHGDVLGMASAVERLLADSDLTDRLRRNARHSALERFGVCAFGEAVRLRLHAAGRPDEAGPAVSG